MGPEEIRNKILSAINHMIKDDPENPDESKASMDSAKAEIHDVLAAKMRDRISPPSEEDPALKMDDPTEDDPEEEEEEINLEDDDPEEPGA